MKKLRETGIVDCRKHGGMRYLICGMAIFLSVFLTACGAEEADGGYAANNADTSDEGDVSSVPAASGENNSDDAASQDQWVYVPEWIEVPDIRADYNAMQLIGDTVCYITRNEEAGEAIQQDICRYSLPDRELTSIPIDWENDGYIREGVRYTFDENGNVWLITNTYPDDFSQRMLFLYMYDAEGKSVFVRDITEQLGSGSFDSIAADRQGRLYVFSSEYNEEEGIWLYTTDGNYEGFISWEPAEDVRIRGTIEGEDGKFYVCFSKGENADHCMLAEVDFEGKRIVEVIKDFPMVSKICADSAGRYDCLLYDDSAAYGYVISTQKKEELLIWQDSDVNGYVVTNLGALKDGRYFCAMNDPVYDDAGLALFTRTKSAEVPERLELVLAAVDGGSGMAALAVDFNRNNSRYHIVVQNYDSLTDIYNAILSKKPIDLIDLSGVNVRNLTRQGALEDLTPYLEQSKTFTRSDFLDGILEAYTFDNILVGIPESFSLQTVVGDGSMLENNAGLTLEECLAIAEGHPGSMPFDAITREEMIHYLMMFNEDTFIDWESGECHFDSAQFEAVLEFVSRFPDSIVKEPEEVHLASKIQSGKVLFAIANMSGVKAFQRYETMFGENAACVGFPTRDGKGGTLLFAGNAFGIAANSENKSGAWDFIESILKRKNTDGMNNEEIYNAYYSYEPGQFPTLKKAMDAVIDYRVEKDKADGREINIDMGGLHFNSHPVTREEIEIIMDLVPNTTPFFSAEDDAVIRIIQEEAGAYYSGQKSVEDVVDIIQNRIQVYVNENR